MAAIRIKKPETVPCNHIREMVEPMLFMFALFSDILRIFVLQSVKFLGKFRAITMFLCPFSLVKFIEKWNELYATTDCPNFRYIYISKFSNRQLQKRVKKIHSVKYGSLLRSYTCRI
jgi:hypothetical protein